MRQLHPELFHEDFVDFLHCRLGRPPVALDILTKVKGLRFDEAYKNAEPLLLEDSVVHLIHVNDLKEAKRSAGRHKDLDDLENL